MEEKLWTNAKSTTRQAVQSFINCCLTRILQNGWPYTLSNPDMWCRTKKMPGVDKINNRRWRYLGYTLRKPEEKRETTKHLETRPWARVLEDGLQLGKPRKNRTVDNGGLLVASRGKCARVRVREYEIMVNGNCISSLRCKLCPFHTEMLSYMTLWIISLCMDRRKLCFFLSLTYSSYLLLIYNDVICSLQNSYGLPEIQSQKCWLKQFCTCPLLPY